MKGDIALAQNLVDFFINSLSGNLSKELIVFIISLLPILELRGGILAAYALDINFYPAFVISYLGNILPIPFILILIEKIFEIMKLTPLKGIAIWFEKKALSKKESIEKYGYRGLFLFVAIPLPGTGAWTGALLAVLLKLNKKKAFLTIMAGVFAAGIIMSILSFGLLNAIGIG